MEDWDYIVVGGGSAGCVVAARLAEDTAARVLLLDAGEESSSPLVRMPGGVSRLVGNPHYDWQYRSLPDPTSGDRAISWSAGRILGGGSAINGMVFNRGLARDYDDWAVQGCSGWSAAEVLPWFQRLEHFERGDWPTRGMDGPVGVEFNRYRPGVLDRYLQACAQAGIAVVEDINALPADGVGRAQSSTWRGSRQSTANTYLRTRPRNLRVLTGTLVTGLRMEGTLCRGVTFERAGVTTVAHARRATVLCAGTFGSPRLLMVSGIGPPELLQKFGIPVVTALPGVGQNLQDHAGVGVPLGVQLPTMTARDLRLPVAAWHALRWLLRGDGMAAGAAMLAVGYARSDTRMTQPDIYLQLAGFAIEPRVDAMRFTDRSAITTFVSVSRPTARGTVELDSADPRTPLRCRLELLGSVDDRRRLIAGLRLVQRVHSASSLRTVAWPDPLPLSGDTDEELLRYAVDHVGTQYHPAGTCRMGRDGLAVVDPELRVHGIGNLLVADASIMPQLTSGNLNAPVMMIGERAAAFLRSAART